MQTLLQAIADACVAATKVATAEHVDAVEATLRSSMKPFPLMQDHTFENIDVGPGIYLIDIQLPFKTSGEFTEFVKVWGHRGSPNLQKGTSRTSPKRAKQHIAAVEAGEFIPLYLGKNMNIRNRVRQHLTGKADSSTYSLKLLSRSGMLKNCTLRASGVVFTMAPEAYFCVQFLEAALRARLHPIIGKQ